MSQPKSESELLERLRKASVATQAVPIPIGDDLAGLFWDRADLLLIGIDQVLDGVHFDAKIHSPAQITRKAVDRNLSDCAAMACLPHAMVMSIAAPRGTDVEALIEGARIAGSRFDCLLVGGDTGVWTGPLAISVAMVGRTDGIAPVTRSGAKPGDKLYVTGPLGGSILGRHIDICPRIHEARTLTRAFDLHAMLDVSDGLSRDLDRLCRASHVGATLDASAIPIHPDAFRMNDAISPLDHALHDGEDHELLFASPHCDHPGVTCVGVIDPLPGVRIRVNDEISPLQPRGWDHRW
jgi:thiamine-monophosphate kinase